MEDLPGIPYRRDRAPWDRSDLFGPAMIGHGQAAPRRTRTQHSDLDRACISVCWDCRGHDPGLLWGNSDSGERTGRRQPLDLLDGVAVPSRAAEQSLHQQSHDDGRSGEWDDVRPACPSSHEPSHRLLLRVSDGQHPANGQCQPPHRSPRASGRHRTGLPLLPGLPGLCPDVPPTVLSLAAGVGPNRSATAESRPEVRGPTHRQLSLTAPPGRHTSEGGRSSGSCAASCLLALTKGGRSGNFFSCRRPRVQETFLK